ncbi:hypothetical protein [Candidatus Enterococcus clewellii]|uniref:Uncharacterized protein n=1 Tax=Candidatus Enterococcus clewellii TaxID=1834193 RepID=A0A242JV19_9ENTE|nr:hypothetical protein [Enterococcus sp. 9E7_DIV0242]OTP06744.1 hypothetical protein A5888_004199 [Enterococcus sp. 9E7_DIV0242]
MNQNIIENKIEETQIRHQVLCGAYASILENLGDVTSSVKDNHTGVTLHLPVEKLDYLISELEKMRTEMQWIDEQAKMMHVVQFGKQQKETEK